MRSVSVRIEVLDRLLVLLWATRTVGVVITGRPWSLSCVWEETEIYRVALGGHRAVMALLLKATTDANTAASW